VDPRPTVSEKAPEGTELGVSPEGDSGVEGRQTDRVEDVEEESEGDLHREGGFQ